MKRGSELLIRRGLYFLTGLFLISALGIAGVALFQSPNGKAVKVEVATKDTPQTQATGTKLERLLKARFTRTISTSPVAAQAASLPPLQSIVRVKGVMNYGNDPLQNEALIEDLRDNQISSMKAGDTIKGVDARIEKIEDDVTFKYSGQLIRLGVATTSTSEEVLPFARTSPATPAVASGPLNNSVSPNRSIPVEGRVKESNP